jgi:hypothetical protein
VADAMTNIKAVVRNTNYFMKNQNDGSGFKRLISSGIIFAVVGDLIIIFIGLNIYSNFN